MKYVISVRKDYCGDCNPDDIFTCLNCEYRLLVAKPVVVDKQLLNELAEEEADKCRSKQQDIDYHNDCVECYEAGFNKAIEMLCE